MIFSLKDKTFWLCKIFGHKWIDATRTNQGQLLSVFCQRCGKITGARNA